MTEKYHYTFIHNVFGNFAKNTLDYFTNQFYTRFKYRVVSTYDKGVEYLNRQAELNREMDMPLLPAIILNPSGDFNLADANTGARQLWRFPNLENGVLFRMYDSIYQDKNIQIVTGFSRFKGELELIILLNSFYEYCDIKVLLIQIFGGVGDRYIYPIVFDSFIILESNLYN